MKIEMDLQRFLLLSGLQPLTIEHLTQKLGIDSYTKLEEAVKKQKIRAIKGLGAKVELNIKKNLKQIREIPDQLPIAFVYPIAVELLSYIRRFPEVKRAELAGSLRRFRETVKDLDLIIVTDEVDPVIDQLTQLPNVSEVILREQEKISIQFQYLWPIKVDLLLVSEASFAHSWIRLTGPYEHYIQLEQRAKDQGTEWEQFKQLQSEEEIYRQLGLSYIPPEVRVGSNELERIDQEGQTPRLIQADDLLGDLHMHTNWSDGGNSIEEMARAAFQRGYRYIAITDHSRSLKIAGGLSIERLLKQKEEIKKIEKKLNTELGEFRILCGVEMDILADGVLDYPDEVLMEMDLVIGSIHTAFNQDEYRLSKRIMDAILNNHVDFIAHPTGRIIGRREPYAVNMEILFTAAKATGTALELNSNPERLDLKPEYLQEAIEKYNIPITINTDAHSVKELNNIEIGVGSARRGWVRAENVINTWPLDRLMNYLKRND